MPNTECERIARDGNRTGIVFVHGFLGDYRKTWGRFPELIKEDSDLNHCDILFWGYPTDFLLPGLPFLGSRLPELSQVSQCLKTDLVENMELGGPYHDLVLVAHSMGGLVVLKMILDGIGNADRKLLQRIRHILLYASPIGGVALPKIARAHRQLWLLRHDSDLVDTLNSDCVKLLGKDGALQFENLCIPVTPVIGLQDNAVPEKSSKAFWGENRCRTSHGNHTEVCKPDDRAHTSYQILRNAVLGSTIPHIVRGRNKVLEVNTRIAQEAEEWIYATGSRGRDPKYFQTIEERLKVTPDLVYHRVLIGPPQKQELKDHLLEVVRLGRAGRPANEKRIYLGLYDDAARQPEVFICGNEKRCLVVLPGATGGIGDYSTAMVFTDPAFLQGYQDLVKALYGASRTTETERAIRRLEVLGLSRSREPEGPVERSPARILELPWEARASAAPADPELAPLSRASGF